MEIENQDKQSKEPRQKNFTQLFIIKSFKKKKFLSWLKLSHSINKNRTHMCANKRWPFGMEATPLRWLGSGCRCDHSRFGRCWLCWACRVVWVPLLRHPRSVLCHPRALTHKQQEVTPTFHLQRRNILKSTEPDRAHPQVKKKKDIKLKSSNPVSSSSFCFESGAKFFPPHIGQFCKNSKKYCYEPHESAISNQTAPSDIIYILRCNKHEKLMLFCQLGFYRRLLN